MTDPEKAALIVDVLELEALSDERPETDLNAIHARYHLDMAKYYMDGNYPVLNEARRNADTARYYLGSRTPVPFGADS